jgi:hypothetical protein
VKSMARSRWVRRADGVVDLTRTSDGLRRCTLCFDLVTPERLFADLEGRVWDVCMHCASEADGWSARSARSARPAPEGTPGKPGSRR